MKRNWQEKELKKTQTKITEHLIDMHDLYVYYFMISGLKDREIDAKMDGFPIFKKVRDRLISEKYSEVQELKVFHTAEVFRKKTKSLPKYNLDIDSETFCDDYRRRDAQRAIDDAIIAANTTKIIFKKAHLKR